MNKKIHIITGSTLGSAEELADLVRDNLTTQGYEVFQNNGGVSLEDLNNIKSLIIITSTYGAGELPENLTNFIYLVKQDSTNSFPVVDYSQINYFVIAIGSREYDTFCSSKDLVEEAFAKATKVSDGLRLDVSDLEFDYEEEAINFVSKNIKLLS